jgi:hypothetical protein
MELLKTVLALRLRLCVINLTYDIVPEHLGVVAEISQTKTKTKVRSTYYSGFL